MDRNHRNANEKKNKRKKNGIYILIFIALIVVFFSQGFTDMIYDRFIRDNMTLETVSSLDVSVAVREQFKIYHDKIISCNGNIITANNFEGIQLWSKSIEYEEPIIELGEEQIYIGNGSTGEMISLDTSGEELWSYNSQLPINRIVENNRYSLIFTKTEDNLDQVSIIDREGKLIGNQVVDKGRLLSGYIAPNGGQFALTTLDITRGDIDSSLIIYDSDGSLVWEKDFKDSIIQNIIYLENDKILITSDEKIFLIQGETGLWNKDLDGSLEFVGTDQEKSQIYILTKESFESINLKGRTKYKIKLSEEYERFYTNDKDIYLVNKNRIKGINNDKVFLDYKSIEEIIDFNVVNDKIIISSINGIKLMELVKASSKK